MTGPDRHAVARMFRRAARTFPQADFFCAEIRSRLLERLELVRLEPATILDLGGGPGAGAAALAARFPAARVVALDLVPEMLRAGGAPDRYAVCADAGRLPFADASIDLVFCNLMLPWCVPAAVFAEVRRVLGFPGLFSFTTAGPDTLRELRRAWAAADPYTHVPEFDDMHTVGDALVRAGFAEPVMHTERVTLTYTNLGQLTADSRAIGASNLTAGRNRGLTGRGAWSRLTAAFATLRGPDGRAPMTIEVIYGQAWAPEPRDHAPGAAREIAVPIARIGRLRR